MNTDRRKPHSFCSDPPAHKTQPSPYEPELLTPPCSDSTRLPRTSQSSSFPPSRSQKSNFDPLDWRERFVEACRDLRLGETPANAPIALFDGFTAQYKTLRELPRRERRSLQRQWKHSLAGVALLFALCAQPALAATIDVGGQCTLARAIVSANNDASPRGFCTPGSGADRIVLPRNSAHTLTRVNNVTFGATGLPVIRSVMTIDGNDGIIRRADSAPDFRILAVAENGNLRLKEATISGGIAAKDATQPVGDGAGGGLFSYGIATVVDSTISGNIAVRGGGLYSYVNADLTVTRSTVSGNQTSGDGGGIYTGEDARLTVSNSTISGNEAKGNGGGIGSGNDSVHVITVVDSTISGNTAVGNGGGVFVGYNSGIRITNSTLSSNVAGQDGGGVFTGYDCRVAVTNSTISGNSARNGGGVSNIGVRGVATLTNVTITRNTATRAGGGIYHSDYALVTDLGRSVVAGNRASSGAELFEEPDVLFGTVTASDFNLFGHSGLTSKQAFFMFAPGARDINATSDGDTPTALGAILSRSLARNGGPTRTHALVTGSPAIDAIIDGSCPPPARDQRGVSRPRDGNRDGGVACDIGSFEVR